MTGNEDPTRADLIRSVGRLEGKLDALIRQVSEQGIALVSLSKDVHRRLDQVESKVHRNTISSTKLWSILIGVGAAGGGAGVWLNRLLGGGGGP